MTGNLGQIDSLNGQLGELESTVESVRDVTSVFHHELKDVDQAMKGASRTARSLSRSIGSSLRRAFDDLVFDGARLSDVLSNIGRSVTGSVFSQSMMPVQTALGSFLGSGLSAAFGGGFAKGGAFSGGRVRAFAKGGVVEGATAFPMRGGTGLMGEAGPEAIMPLTRAPDGSLGVRSSGGQKAINVTINISTPDVAGFQRSRAQIAAGLNRALRQGTRNL